MNYYQNLGLGFSALSGVEGGGAAINNIYGIGAYPTYILIAPNYDIVEQDMWPISSTQTFINYFESNGLEQADCNPVAAEFIADATEVCEMDVVSFTDISTGEITTWEWTFEGGDPATSSEQNPAVTYNEQGVYDVELTVSDGLNSSNVLMEDYITVLITPPTMLAPFDDVCVDWPPFELTGGSPTGGVYSGPGVTDGWFDPAEAGVGTHMITYTYTGLSGCDNSDEQPLIVDACTGIADTEAAEFNIYPNPSAGKFNLKLNYQGDVVIEIINIIGVKIYQEQVNIATELVKTIDLQGLEKGIYFVSIQTDDKTFVKKLKLLD